MRKEKNEEESRRTFFHFSENDDDKSLSLLLVKFMISVDFSNFVLLERHEVIGMTQHIFSTKGKQ